MRFNISKIVVPVILGLIGAALIVKGAVFTPADGLGRLSDGLWYVIPGVLIFGGCVICLIMCLNESRWNYLNVRKNDE